MSIHPLTLLRRLLPVQCPHGCSSQPTRLMSQPLRPQRWLSGLAAAHGTNAAAGNITGATGLDGFSSGTLTAFAVVVDSTDLASAQNYFLASGGATKDVTFTSATGNKSLAFGSQATITQAAGAWTAVPEPTSGLLLLLGMAGLALKRKVA